MSKNNELNNFNFDKRLRTIKDTIDKMCWDHYIPPKTVTKTAEQYLTEDTTVMGHILNESSEVHKALDEMNTLLVNTNQYCDDLNVEIQKAFNMFGLEMPNEEQLLGESVVYAEEGEGNKEESRSEGMTNGTVKDESDSMGGLQFCEPTPAKPKASSKKLF